MTTATATIFSNRQQVTTAQRGNLVAVWSLTGPRGGVSYRIHCWEAIELKSCNLEFHHQECPHPKFVAPDHLACWLTKLPCWHHGEDDRAQLLHQQVLQHFNDGDDAAIYRLLETEYLTHFEPNE